MFALTGLKAKIKITCKEVQSSVFLPVSITTSSTIDIMGFKAEASYLAAIHYREVKTDIQPETSTDKTTKPVTANAVAQPKKHKFERPARSDAKGTQVDSLAVSEILFIGPLSVACRCDWKKCRVINIKKKRLR